MDRINEMLTCRSSILFTNSPIQTNQDQWLTKLILVSVVSAKYAVLMYWAFWQVFIVSDNHTVNHTCGSKGLPVYNLENNSWKQRPNFTYVELYVYQLVQYQMQSVILFLFPCFPVVSGNNHENTGQAQVVSTSKSVQNSSSERHPSESTTTVKTRQEDLHPNSRIPNEFRTPQVERNKSYRTPYFPPPSKTPLAASTPVAMVPAQQSSTNTMTTPLENRTCGTIPQQDSYSVLPEGDLF